MAFLTLWGKMSLAHSFAYIITVAIGYPLLTSKYFIGEEAVFDRFMITPNDSEQWIFALYLTIPVQILRALLYTTAFFPFFSIWKQWNHPKRIWSLGLIFLFFGFWASPLAAPGSIEGLIYLKPFVHLLSHLSVQFEIVGHAFLCAFFFSSLNPHN